MAEDAGKLLVDGVMNVAAANAALGEASLTEAIEETQKKLDFGELKTWLDPDYYEPLQRAAERLAKTSWVPPEFRDKPEDLLCALRHGASAEDEAEHVGAIRLCSSRSAGFPRSVCDSHG